MSVLSNETADGAMPIRTRIELPDTRGLICAFRFVPGEPARQIGWPEVAGVVEGTAQGLTWLHFNLTDGRAAEWIKGCERIPQAARESLLSADAHVRLKRAGDTLVGVLDDLHHDFDADPEAVGLVRLYADRTLLITGRRHPLKATDQLRREAYEGLKADSMAMLLARLLDYLGETYQNVIGGIMQDIDAIEDRVLDGHFHREGTNLGKARRLVSRLRRHLGAERQALQGVLAHLPEWCSGPGEIQIAQSAARLETVAQDLDLLQERGRLLQDELAGRLGEATNRNLYILSIVTTVFLPITLITGLFGMNVGGLPWLQDTFGFWWVLLGMAATAGLALLLLHWRRLF